MTHMQHWGGGYRRGVGVPTHFDYTEDEEAEHIRDIDTPQEEWEGVEVPHVELIVKGTGETHPDEIRWKQHIDDDVAGEVYRCELSFQHW